MDTWKKTCIFLIATMLGVITIGYAAVPTSTPADTAQTYTNGTSVIRSDWMRFDESLYAGTTVVISGTGAGNFTTLNTGFGDNELYEMNQDVLTVSNVTFNRVNVTEYYLDSVDVTTALVTQTASYIVDTDGTNYWAINGSTGETEFSGVDATTVYNDVISIAPTNAVIYSKEGTYILDPVTAVYSANWVAAFDINNKNLIFKGPGTFKLKDGIVGGTGVIIFYIRGTSNVKFYGCNFDCNQATQAPAATWIDAVFVDDSAKYTVDGCSFIGYKYALYGDPDTTSTGYLITNNVFQENGKNCIGLHNYGDYSIISNNIIINAAKGIQLDTVSNVVIENNQFIGIQTAGVEFYDGGSRNTVSGNHFFKEYGIVTSVAVHFYYTAGKAANINNIITDNIIDGTGATIDYGVRFDNIQDLNNVISNNQFVSVTTPIDQNYLPISSLIRDNKGYISPGEERTVSGSLTAGVANAIAFAWNNPEAQDILIKKIVIEVTTAGGTVGSHLDVGIADDATGTNRGTEFFDDLLLNTAQVDDSWVAGDGGTQTKWVFCQDTASATDDWIVGQILDANAASLVGKYYIIYAGR